MPWDGSCWGGVFRDDASPKVGRPKRDRKKVNSSRKAARRNRGR